MNYIIQNTSVRKWDDKIRFIYFLKNEQAKKYVLSKRKILKNLSDAESFTELYILLLDNLSKTYSIIFSKENEELILILSEFVDIRVKVNKDDCEQILLFLEVSNENNFEG